MGTGCIMKVYGFNDLKVIDESIRLARLSLRGDNTTGNTGLEIKLLQTPTGGIPARTGTTAGSADCADYTIGPDGSMNTTDATDVEVFNPFTAEIGGDTYIIATRINGVWVITAEDCEV